MPAAGRLPRGGAPVSFPRRPMPLSRILPAVAFLALAGVFACGPRRPPQARLPETVMTLLLVGDGEVACRPRRRHRPRTSGRREPDQQAVVVRDCAYRFSGEE